MSADPRSAADSGGGLPVLEKQGAVAVLRLNRPAQRNALRGVDLHHLLACFAQIDADPAIRVAMLAADAGAAGRPVFCAGFDIAGFGDAGHDPRLFERVADALQALRPVTVCAMSGSAYGGATDLVLACDLRVAVRGAEFRMPAAQLGLHYYPGGLRRYVVRLGLDLAKRAFLGGRGLRVEEMQAGGAFDAVAEPAGFDAAVADLVARVLALAPLAAQATKRSLDELAAGTADEAQLRAREAATLASTDFAEGRAARAQGRRPNFQGV